MTTLLVLISLSLSIPGRQRQNAPFFFPSAEPEVSLHLSSATLASGDARLSRPAKGEPGNCLLSDLENSATLSVAESLNCREILELKFGKQ